MFTRFLFAFVFVVSCGVVFAEDWHRYRGPRCDGVSRETDWKGQWPEEGPEIAWRTEVGVGLSAVSISDGRAYTMGNQDDQDVILCLDTATGKEIWRHTYPSPADPNEFDGGPTSTPTVDGQFVYTLGRLGDVHALDKTSGEVRWHRNVAERADIRVPSWGFSGSPLAYHQLLILNVGDAGVAVNKLTGDQVWASEDKDAGYSTPILVRGRGDDVIAMGSARSYVGVDALTGNERWRQRWLTTFGCNAADPIVSGDRLFLSSGYNRGSALLDLSQAEPTIVWKHKEFQNQISTSVLMYGHLYGASGDIDAGAKLVCMELATGVIKWAQQQIRVGGISGAGDRLVVLSDSGELIIVAASADKFQQLAAHSVLDGKCWTAPVLSNGRIYCRSTEGRVVCVDVEP